MASRRRLCKAVDCEHVIGDCEHAADARAANARYCSTTCSKRMRDRRLRTSRRQKEIEALVAEPSAENRRRAEIIALRPRRNALRVRRGPAYDTFVVKGWPDKIAAGDVTEAEAARLLETTKANVSGWMAAWEEDRARAEVAGTWQLGEEARRALGDFVYFRSRYFVDEWGEPYVTTAYHRRWIVRILRAMQVGGRSCILSPPRHGKRLADSTPVLTPTGWRTHGDLVPGDEVFAPDGRPTTVVGVTAREPCGRLVRFSDGAEFKADGGHRWTVWDRAVKRYRTMTTDEMRRAGLHKGTLSNGEPRRRFLVDYTAPLAMPEADLPLDPYVLGVWLGDGKADGGTVSRAPGDFEDVLLLLKERGWEPSWSTVHPTTGVRYAGFAGLAPILRRLSLLGDRHIPPVYFTASEEQRRELLRGLVDADGHVDRATGRVRVVTVDERLATDTARLVHTLGYRTTTTHQAPALSSSGIQGRRRVYTVQWTPHDGACQAYLERKDHRRVTVRRRRSVVSVEPCPPEPGRCIAVAHPSQLYLVGHELVPTHNTDLLTHFCIWLILRNPNIRVLWVGLNEEIAKQSVDVIRELLESNELLRADFLPEGGTFQPPSRSGRPWTSGRLIVATRTRTLRSPTIVAIGKGGKLLSRDADLVVVDDIIDHESVESAAQREKDVRWINTQVSTRKEKHTALVAIGSRQHHHDLYGRVVKNTAWESIVETAHDPNCLLPRHQGSIPEGHDEWGDTTCPICTQHRACLLWPGKRTFAWLEEQRIAMDDDEHFEMVYLNKTRPAGALHLTEEDVKRCFDVDRSIGQYPAGCHLIAGLDPASGGDQVAFLWAYHPEEERRYMVDVDVERAGGLPGAQRVIRLWAQLYPDLKMWVVERNAYQTAILQDRDITEFCSVAGIALIPHFTDKHNKYDPEFGVTKQFAVFKQLGPVVDPLTGKPTDEVRPKVDLPYKDEGSRAKAHLYRDQLLDFEGATRKTRTDVVMAAWFPETQIRVWRREAHGEAVYRYQRTEYPFAPMGDAYRRTA